MDDLPALVVGRVVDDLVGRNFFYVLVVVVRRHCGRVEVHEAGVGELRSEG